MKALKEIFGSMFNSLVIIVCFVIGYLIYSKVMGNPMNFEGGNIEGHVVKGNYLGIIYRGGVIVPLLMNRYSCIINFLY